MRRTVLSVVLGVTLLGVAVPHAQTPAANAKAVSDQLMTNEKALLDAVVKHDWYAFSAFIAPDAWSVDEGGPMAMKDFRNVWDSVKVSSQTPTEIKVVTVAPSVSLVTYKLEQHGTYQGQQLPLYVYATTTWVNRGGKWVAIFHQESTAAPARK